VRARHVDVQVSSRLSLAREYQGAQAHGTSVPLQTKNYSSEKKKLVSPNLVGIFFFFAGACVGTGSETFSLLLPYEHEIVLFRGVLHSGNLGSGCSRFFLGESHGTHQSIFSFFPSSFTVFMYVYICFFFVVNLQR
jgi:hypothetical protein